MLQRDCDNKTRECQEYSAKIKDLKVKHEARLRQVTEENRRLEKLLQMKETEIMSSEARAKELVMRAEEFEDMFNGQLEVSLEAYFVWHVTLRMKRQISICCRDFLSLSTPGNVFPPQINGIYI